MDTGNQRIQVFDASSLSFSRILGLEAGNIDLNAPTAAAVKDDTLYIVENGGASIVTANKYTGSKGGISLSLAAERSRGIAIYGSEIVVSNPSSKTVSHYDLSFNYLSQTDTPARVYRLDFMPDGRLVACGSTIKTEDSSVYQFSADYSSYSLVPPQVSSALKTPQAVAMDSSGNYYIADYTNSRIQVYNSSLVYKFSITAHVNTPLDIAYNNGLLYLLNKDATVQVYNTSGTYLNSYDVSFSVNPLRLDVINATQLVLVDASSLYFVSLDGSTVTPYKKTHARATFPRDVTVAGSKINYLCNANGDMLVYNTDGVLLEYVAASGYTYHPSAAISISAASDGTVYVCDEAAAALFRYDDGFNYIGRYDLSKYGVSSPYSLYGHNQDVYICMPAANEVGKFSASAFTGGFIIKVDGDIISGFSSDIFSYDFKVDADQESVDIDCLVSGGYSVSGAIGRYLLDYGLNIFTVKIKNDGDTDTYTLYVTRDYPDGFLLTDETIDAFLAYQSSGGDSLPAPSDTRPVSSIRLQLNFKNLNPEAVEVVPLSKHVKAVLNGSELMISWDDAGDEASPSILLSSSDDFTGLNEQAVKEMIAQRRNLFILLASLAGAVMIFGVYYFTRYLQRHPGKRQYLKYKFKKK